MFYILESDTQIQHLTDLRDSSAYVQVIPTSYSKHPALTKILAVYIKPTEHGKGYIIPIDHEEGLNIHKDRVYELLNSFPTLYTLDKKNLLYYFNIQSAIDIQLLYSTIEYDKIDINVEGKLTNWYSNKFKDFPDINRLIPISKLYEDCERTYDKVRPVLDLEIPESFEFYNNTATNVFYLLEQPGLGIFYNAFVELFTPRDPKLNIIDNKVLTSYNLYNVTSRPTNAFNSINFAAIPKSEEHRRCFTPQNDYFVEFDFDGYHLRLLCEQIGYELTDESAHKQLAKHYFGTEDITEEQYIEAKQINFHAIYGRIPEQHKNLEIFKLIQKYIDNMWETYQTQGYISNPISKKRFTHKLKNMNPAKLMNYMMQSLETSRNILILKKVLNFLKTKKTSPVLYTYDAILFDFAKEEGKELLQELEEILGENGKYPVKFKYNKNLVL